MSCCKFFSYMRFSRCAALRLPGHLFKSSGGHLLCHTVSSAVPSAAYVLTIVFGMGTGVTPGRIVTRNFSLLSFYLNNSTVKHILRLSPLYLSILRKEVIQPHLPIRLPCYDFTPVISPAFDCSLHKGWVTGFGRC